MKNWKIERETLISWLVEILPLDYTLTKKEKLKKVEVQLKEKVKSQLTKGGKTW